MNKEIERKIIVPTVCGGTIEVSPTERNNGCLLKMSGNDLVLNQQQIRLLMNSLSNHIVRKY